MLSARDQNQKQLLLLMVIVKMIHLIYKLIDVYFKNNFSLVGGIEINERTVSSK